MLPDTFHTRFPWRSSRRTAWAAIRGRPDGRTHACVCACRRSSGPLTWQLRRLISAQPGRQPLQTPRCSGGYFRVPRPHVALFFFFQSIWFLRCTCQPKAVTDDSAEQNVLYNGRLVAGALLCCGTDCLTVDCVDICEVKKTKLTCMGKYVENLLHFPDTVLCACCSIADK